LRALVWLALACAGCTHRAEQCVGGLASAPHAATESQLPAVGRGTIEPGLDSLPSVGTVPDSRGGPAAVPTYRALTEPECQCLAAHASDIGNLLDREAEAVSDGSELRHRGPKKKDQRRADMQRAVLKAGALEGRNRSAGDALQLYFRLAEAEARFDLLRDSLGQTGKALLEAEKLRKQGFRVPPELETLERQQMDLLADQARLQKAVEQLNIDLAKKIGVDACPPADALWPHADFGVSGAPVDTDSAITFALEHRPQLIVLRELSHNLDSDTLPAARQLLQAANPMAGTAKSEPRFAELVKLAAALKGTSADAKELDARQNQLEELLRDRERAVADEVRQAARSLRTQTRLVSLGKERVLYWQVKVRDQEQKIAKGTGSELDLTSVKLPWLKARGELIQEVMAWHVARAQLKQAQGLLSLECGYSPDEVHTGHGEGGPPCPCK
jgi:hypothetical protein